MGLYPLAAFKLRASLAPMRGMRAVAVVLMLTVSACATARDFRPVNAPSATPNATHPLEAEGDMIALAFSGGGARAAAFSLGALEGLREMRGRDGRPLTERIRLITAVSGGAIIAAYIGQHGVGGIDTFRAAYLDKDWDAELHMSYFSPLNWSRAWGGGLNERADLADWLDREVFAGGAMRDVLSGDTARPQIWINAADLYNGTQFAFAPDYFDALCSDLASVRLGDAVSASMGVPVFFRPVLVEPYPQACPPQPAWVATARTDRSVTALERRTAQALASYRDPARMRYVHLVDGGVVDNLGLSSLTLEALTAHTPYGPLSERSAVRVRRITFLVVNAEKLRAVDWQRNVQGPSGTEQLDAVFDIAIEAPNRAAYDAFRALVRDWRERIVTWRCALPRAEIVRLRGDMRGWDCRDFAMNVDMISFSDLDEETAQRLGHVATRVSLPAETIDVLIAGGRRAMTQNPTAQAAMR